MGREIRRVPADWEHPREDCTHSPWNGGCDDAKAHGGRCLQPLYDESFSAAAAAWKAEYAAWERGERPEHCDAEDSALEFWEWHGSPPERKYYRPEWTEGSATHYQVYETVSEGTPVTPHFATKAELIDYLVAHGDFWDQSRTDGGWPRANAERFVECEYAPSIIAVVSELGASIQMP